MCQKQDFWVDVFLGMAGFWMPPGEIPWAAPCEQPCCDQVLGLCRDTPGELWGVPGASQGRKSSPGAAQERPGAAQKRPGAALKPEIPGHPKEEWF